MPQGDYIELHRKRMVTFIRWAKYTALGVVTKGTIIVVNVSELGLVTPAEKWFGENTLRRRTIQRMTGA